MKKEKLVLVMTAISFWLWTPNQTNAQQDSLSATTLRDVVVTATKFPKDVSETGKVLAIIDEDQLSRSVGKDLSQLLNEQVGLVINGANSNPAKDKSVFLRGAAGKYTLILMDGVPVHDPSGIDGAFDLRLLSIDQIERIEILKGSQSTLYGTDAISGVINIITKKKSDKPVSGTGTLSYGSYNTFRGNAGLSGSTGKIDYNLGYTRLQTEGISEAKDETGSGNFDKDGFDQHAFQLSVGFKPLNKLSVRPFMRYNDFNGAYDAGAFEDDPDAVYDAGTLNVGAQTDYQFTQGSVVLQFAHNKTKRSFSNPYGIYDYDGRFNHGELFTQYELTDHFQLLGGFSYQHFMMVATNTTVENPASSMASPYLSIFIRNLKGFSTEIGGRYVNHSAYGDNFTYSINPSYRLQNKMKLFLNYASGFKAPTLSQLYGPFGANENLKPEESTSAEGGVQVMLSDNRLDIRATYFNRKIKNVITFISEYENIDKLDDQGVELETFYRLNKLTLTGYYAYVEGAMTTPTVQGTESRSNDLIRRPKHSMGLNIGYQATDKLYTSLNFKTFGKRNDEYFDLNTFTSEPVVLDPYQLLDVYLEYRFLDGRLKVFADLRNLLNREYFEVYGYSVQRFNATGGVVLTF
jgi:vitamin B12 transporter